MPILVPNTMRHEPLSIRAIATGILFGSILTICNIYMGLKVGWTFNLSVLAALLGFIFWHSAHSLLSTKKWSLTESNIQQTTTSAACSTMAAGLVAPIPAYLIITERSFEYWPMVIWMIAISLLGICVASVLRPAMVNNPRLPFPAGIATAEVIKDIFDNGHEAKRKIHALFIASTLALSHRVFFPETIKLSLGFSIPGNGALAGTSISAKNLGFVLEPSYMLLAFGSIIGIRSGLSMLLGCIISWIFLGPYILGQGWELAGPVDSSWFKHLVDWLLWPGVSLMLASSITSTAIVLIRSNKTKRLALDWHWQEFLLLGTITPVIVILQIYLFDISWFAAILAVPLAFLFAIVAAQVVGETGIPPIGALGKLSQLSFSIISPGSVTTNLMTANVSGGAAGQATDLLNDLKAGYLLGTSPRQQFIAQACGIVAGCLISAAIFMLLIPNPATQLMTEQWPAPGVAIWKSVAIALTEGLEAIPQSARYAMFIGIIAATINELLPLFMKDKWHKYLPSMSAMGLAFVLPAQVSIMLFIGAFLAWFLRRLAPKWSQRFMLAIAAGFIAGESIAGVLASMLYIFR